MSCQLGRICEHYTKNSIAAQTPVISERKEEGGERDNIMSKGFLQKT